MTSGEIIAQYVENYILRAGNMVISEGVQTGRSQAAEDLEANGVQYSALMDSKTCPICGSLDNRVIDLRTSEGRELHEKYHPAMHHNCRCVWIYIFENEFNSENDTFEKDWLAKLKKDFPKNSDLTRGQIMEKHARFNLDSRWHLWKDDWDDVRGERLDKIGRKIERFEKKIVKVISEYADSPNNDLIRQIYKTNDGKDNNQNIGHFYLNPEMTESVNLYLTPGKNTKEPTVEFDTLKEILAKQKPEFLRRLNAVEITLSDLEGQPGGKHVDGGYGKNFIVLTTQNDRFLIGKDSLAATIEHSFDHELGHHVRQLMEYAKEKVIDDEKFRQFGKEYDKLFDDHKVQIQEKYGIIAGDIKNDADRKAAEKIVKEEYFANLFRAYKQGDSSTIEKSLEDTNISRQTVNDYFGRLLGE